MFLKNQEQKISNKIQGKEIKSGKVMLFPLLLLLTSQNTSFPHKL